MRMYDHYLANKAYLSAITAKNIYESFTHKMAAKAAGIEIASMSPYVYELKREFASQTAAANQLRDADACDQ